MNQFKQNAWVVSILFFSLISSVALCYAITPNPQTLTEQVTVTKNVKTEPVNKDLNKTLTILLPQVVK